MALQRKRIAGVLAATVIALAAGAQTDAAQITALTANGPGLSSLSGIDIYHSISGNDDLQVVNMNWVSFNLFYDEPKYIDTVFTVISDETDQTVTEYDYGYVGHRNNTSEHWYGMKMWIGYYENGQFRAAGSTGLDFDDPDPNASFEATNFYQVTRSADYLYFTGDPVYRGSTEWQNFPIDIPGRSSVPSYAWTNDGYQFVIRTVPVVTVPVPEPAVVFPLALVATGLLRRR